MINTKNYEMSQKANVTINKELAQRIPNLLQYRFDDNPNAVSPVDFFGSIDTIMHFGSTKIWSHQQKSRCAGRKDLCFEINSYRGKFINPETQKSIPITGAHYYEATGCWLAPRLGDSDCVSYYLPDYDVVMHFSRYYLDILFSGEEIWTHATGISRMYDCQDSYVVFFDYKDFIRMYMNCVGNVTCGAKISAIMASNKEISNTIAKEAKANQKPSEESLNEGGLLSNEKRSNDIQKIPDYYNPPRRFLSRYLPRFAARNRNTWIR